MPSPVTMMTDMANRSITSGVGLLLKRSRASLPLAATKASQRTPLADRVFSSVLVLLD
jgi:hypothetical protein